MIKQSLAFLKNWCFPPTCVLTKLPGLVSLDLSAEIVEGFKYQTIVCPICAEPTYDGLTIYNGLICGTCLSHKPSFDATQVFYDFDHNMRKLIHLYKFKGNHAISQILAELMLDNLEVNKVEAIVAVPLHISRLRERGFNQSLEVAKIISKRLKLPLILNGVERLKPTVSQTTLSKVERYKNLNGVFKVNVKDFKGVENLAIIDDVMTTGTTIEALAKQIKKHTDIITIEAWVVAKAR